MGQGFASGIRILNVESPGQEIADRQAFAQLRDRAYRLLARREHSQWELRQKLHSHDGADQLDRLVAVLTEEGSLSDDRFAEQLVRSKVSAGKGPRVILQELKRHRLEEDIIHAVLSEYRDRWNALADSVRLKKFGREAPADYRAWTKQARFLQQRGFSPDHIGSYDGRSYEGSSDS